MTRKAAILIENGFCARSVTQMTDALKRAGVASELVSSRMGMITAKDGTQLEAAKDFTTSDAVLYDAVYVPGGADSVAELSKHSDARNFINGAFHHAKSIAASDEGMNLLASTDVSTLPPLQDGSGGGLKTNLGVVGIKDAKDMTGFFEEFIKLIAMHRHWARHH